MATAEDIKFRFTAQDDISKQLKRVNDEFKQLATNAKVGGQSVLKTTQNMSKGFAGAGRGAGMAGMQVQQLVGQVQAGTNPMLALSQQAADLGFVLGAPMAGAIAGIGASIAMVLLPNLFSASKGIEEISEAIDDLSLSYKDLSAAEKELKQLELTTKLQEQKDELASLKSQLDNNTAAFESQRDAVNEDMYAMELSAEATKTFKDEEITLKGEMSLLERQIKATEENLAYYSGTIDKTAEETKKLKDESQDYIDKLKEEIALFNATDAEKRAYEIKQLAEGYRAEAQALSDNLAAKEAAKEAEEQLEKDKDAAIRQLTSLRLNDEKENLKNSFVEQQALLEQFRAKNLITEEQYAASKARLDERMQASAVASFAGGMEALGRYNKKAFQIAKIAKTGEAVMNTYAGVTQALAAYPPPFSYIAAAGQLAFGMAQVAQIKSQSFSGRAVGGRVEAGSPYMVGEQGREMFIPSTRGQIVKNSDVEAMGSSSGTTNINFSITTVDARGFDELLNSRRGQIVNMVNRAMNDRGRTGVTA